MRSYLVLAKLFLPLVCLLLLSSCAGTPRGQLSFSGEVAKEFSSGKARSDHNYYYYGRSGAPIAILGLQNQITLISDAWVPIDNPKENLLSYVKGNKKFGKPVCTARGATIFDPSQKQIGIWYGKWNLTGIQSPAPGQITIFPPKAPSSGSCKPKSNNS